MLSIREEQMKELSKYMLRRFEDRMVIYLRSAFQEQTAELTEPDLRALIRVGTVQAGEDDVTDEADVERYLECMVKYGGEFNTNDETSWAGVILDDSDLSGTEKMNKINDHELFVLGGDEP